MKKIHTIALSLLAAAGCGGLCQRLPPAGELDQLTDQMIKSSFQTKGIAKVERITEVEDTLKACNAADVAGKPLAPRKWPRRLKPPR
jgi:sulfur-oxidizing protein SoxX